MRTVSWKTACAVILLFLAPASASFGQTFKDLVNFNLTVGYWPYSSLVQGTDGNLYGTASAGGPYGGGVVFRLTPSGAFTIFYAFCSQTSCADGETPVGLVLGTDENFYGVTGAGGSFSTSCDGIGCGTVFRITRNGVLTTLHSFGDADGETPAGTLVQGTDGSLYGTTEYGGANTCMAYYGSVGCGSIFKITPQGSFTGLYSFDASGPWQPVGGLIQARDGNFYGTTYSGGANGRGTVFRMSPEGTITTLYSFCAQTNCTDGSGPYAALVQAQNGGFYGTTIGGGAAFCFYGQQGGTVFKITSEGALTTLHSFCLGDGYEPEAPLVQATDGNFYGTTVAGGDGGAYQCTAFYQPDCGTVFEITPARVLTTLHSFNFLGGAYPYAGLVQATSGVFYGTTVGGGQNQDCLDFDYYGCGAAFSLNTGLSPFVITVPTARSIGQGVIILGTNLTGTTSVTFNGTAATFKVVSATEIATSVPAGATTGTVQVVTPGGTLSSNVPFRVIQ